MVKIDLITGFLGSGKTTFIRKYAQYLMEQGMNIGILENDYGAVNVDMMLLQDLLGDNCELEMVAGGCDKDCHRRRFKTKLIAMGMCGYDRVLVEPSGIFDVDEFFDALREEPLDQWYEIGNVIAIVDAKLEKELSDEADFILASEVADAGCILLSHADETTAEEMDATVAHINEALEKIHCKRRLEKEILRKSTPQLTSEDLHRIMSSGYVMENYEKMDLEEHSGFESQYFMNVPMTAEKMQKVAKEILEDSSCGAVFRIKGFIKAEDNSWIQLNATHNGVRMEPIQEGQEVIIVIGECIKSKRYYSVRMNNTNVQYNVQKYTIYSINSHEQTEKSRKNRKMQLFVKKY